VGGIIVLCGRNHFPKYKIRLEAQWITAGGGGGSRFTLPVPEDIDEGNDHEVLPEAGDLGNVVEEAEDLGLDGGLPRELVQHGQEQLHAGLVKENLPKVGKL
jgi:hypothetical protein